MLYSFLPTSDKRNVQLDTLKTKINDAIKALSIITNQPSSRTDPKEVNKVISHLEKEIGKVKGPEGSLSKTSRLGNVIKELQDTIKTASVSALEKKRDLTKR